MPDHIDALAAAVVAELRRAEAKHAPMHSPHEGWSVIYEELEELREHVRADTGRGEAARKEAIQVAAMGLRYALNVAGWREAWLADRWRPAGRPDWDDDGAELHDLLLEADVGWLTPFEAANMADGRTIWAVLIPIGDADGNLEGEEVHRFDTEAEATRWCAEARAHG